MEEEEEVHTCGEVLVVGGGAGMHWRLGKSGERWRRGHFLLLWRRGGGGGGRRWREEVEGGGAPLTPPMVHHHPLEVGHLWLSYVHLFLFNPNLGRLQLPIVLKPH